jgi:hypothetical protein
MTTLTKKQINWLDKCANGRWTLNPKTGLVDVCAGFDCYHQRLKDFKGVKFGIVSESFYCYGNQLTSLEGAPQKVGNDFNCGYNSLTSLVGAPQKVGGYFFCYNNRLTSLEGAPLKVGGELWCDANPVSVKTLDAIFDKMRKGHSFLSAAASLRNKMSEEEWKLITTNIPEAIRPGVSMLARFGAFV